MLEMIEASSASASASLRRGLKAITSIMIDTRPAPTMATGSAAQIGTPACTVNRPMKAPDMNTAPWAMFMMRWMPKISVKPRANSAYTPPRTRPLRTCCAIMASLFRQRQPRARARRPPRLYQVQGAGTNLPSLTCRNTDP